MNLDNFRLLRDPGHFLALGGGSGLLPKAPGTAGTVVGMVIFWPLAALDNYVYTGLVLALFALGVPLCSRTSLAIGANDHPAIVWDEIVGILLTMAFVDPNPFNCILGFLAFRIFDIFKPWPINVLDQRVRGGIGVMLDDVFAALYAGLTLVFIEYISYI
ncbi:MAG TPA: phosphatidylglycerophosphatase A [Gammaproteobacteria bacterium]|nr:phosphatidylglycerophosphatase A [Gammaproteobacteria bacterium]|tara:strand:- start:1411 stop:1890 length:480 start_codon:yes stop_codon:yes gene_type:complete